MVITFVLTPKAVLLATYYPSGLKRSVQITIHQNTKTTDLKTLERVILIMKYLTVLERNLAGKLGFYRKIRDLTTNFTLSFFFIFIIIIIFFFN